VQKNKNEFLRKKKSYIIKKEENAKKITIFGGQMSNLGQFW
jgi:hypothetical protein